MTLEDYLRHLPFSRHPEGGYYIETYRSDLVHSFSGFDGVRNLSTSILYLLPEGESSGLHRIKSDEIWYHQDGGTLRLTEVEETGERREIRIGKDLASGAVIQHVVKAGLWFGSAPELGSVFVLLGCSVSPGFDFRDFELR
jgi:predicted cupin superfamily sugar epimerase